MHTHKKIAVAGATGRVGRHVVAVLKERGLDAAPMSRTYGVDVITGAGLRQALEGVESIIDAATGASPQQEPATEFFVTAARNLQTTGQQAGVQRIVVVSIIATDRFTAGYGAAKMAHERAMRSGPIPARVLRAAQFHEFVPELVKWGARDGVAYVPRMRTQLVAARTVAEALVDLALRPTFDAEGPIPEIAGPREENLVDVARLLVARRGDPLRIEGVTDTSDPDYALYESGALLPSPHAVLGGPTFAEWLETSGTSTPPTRGGHATDELVVPPR